MVGNNDKVETFFNNKLKLEIPIYQRDYSWEYIQCKELIKDIEIVAQRRRTNESLGKHFIGMVMLAKMRNDDQHYQIIDGQQRITTITLLLHILYKNLSKEFIKGEILSWIYERNDDGDLIRPKLILNENDNDVFIELLKIDNENYIKYNDNNQLIKNYKYMNNLCDKSEFSYEELFAAIKKLYFVKVVMDNDDIENPQCVFESINSTGLNLKDSDLIKNYLMMGLPIEKQKEAYFKYWKTIEENIDKEKIEFFIQSFLKLKSDIPNEKASKNNLYSNYKLYIQGNGLSENEALNDLKQMSEIFKKLNNPSVYFDTKTVQYLNDIEDCVGYKGNVDFMSLLMALVELHIAEKDSDIFWKSLFFIENLLFRLKITNSNTSRFPPIILNSWKKSPEKSLNKYYEIMLKKISTSEYIGMPNDEDIRETLYKNLKFSPAFCRFILRKIEEKVSQKEIADMTSHPPTLEHIMPQKIEDSPSWQRELGSNCTSVHEECLNMIGNLTLTGLNSELSNKPFVDKKKIYGESKFEITKELQKKWHWTEKEIRDRTSALSEIIIEIFSMPEDYKDIINKSKTSETEFDKDYFIVTDVDISKTRPRKIVIDGEKQYLKNNNWVEFTKAFYKWALQNAPLDTLIEISNEGTSDMVIKIEDINDPPNGSYVNILDKIWLKTSNQSKPLFNNIQYICERLGWDKRIVYSLKSSTVKIKSEQSNDCGNNGEDSQKLECSNIEDLDEDEKPF